MSVRECDSETARRMNLVGNRIGNLLFQGKNSSQRLTLNKVVNEIERLQRQAVRGKKNG